MTARPKCPVCGDPYAGMWAHLKAVHPKEVAHMGEEHSPSEKDAEIARLREEIKNARTAGPAPLAETDVLLKAQVEQYKVLLDEKNSLVAQLAETPKAIADFPAIEQAEYFTAFLKELTDDEKAHLAEETGFGIPQPRPADEETAELEEKLSIEDIHESLVNGQREQMATQIKRYGNDFFEDYDSWLISQGMRDAMAYQYFADAVKTYFRITKKGKLREEVAPLEESKISDQEIKTMDTIYKNIMAGNYKDYELNDYLPEYQKLHKKFMAVLKRKAALKEEAPAETPAIPCKPRIVFTINGKPIN
jgi:hypothetical protein